MQQSLLFAPQQSLRMHSFIDWLLDLAPNQWQLSYEPIVAEIDSVHFDAASLRVLLQYTRSCRPDQSIESTPQRCLAKKLDGIVRSLVSEEHLGGTFIEFEKGLKGGSLKKLETEIRAGVSSHVGAAADSHANVFAFQKCQLGSLFATSMGQTGELARANGVSIEHLAARRTTALFENHLDLYDRIPVNVNPQRERDLVTLDRNLLNRVLFETCLFSEVSDLKQSSRVATELVGVGFCDLINNACATSPSVVDPLTRMFPNEFASARGEFV